MDEGAASAATGADGVGATLRAARERAGLSLNEIAARTRIPVRHLEAIEVDDYSALPSPTYASGFAKAYARAVDLDEATVGRQVRGVLAGAARRQPEYQPYEPADPARVPTRGLMIVALGAALAVLILGGLYFGAGLFRAPSGAVAGSAAPVATAPVAAPSPAAPVARQVVVTATDEVWLRLYDADSKTLHQGTLQRDQSFYVPADARDPMINVGRPDRIRITINGSAVQGLDLGRDPIKDVRVSAAALTARAAGVSPSPTPSPSAAARTDEPRRESRDRSRSRESDRRRERPARAAPDRSETQRANLDAAPATPPAGNAQ